MKRRGTYMESVIWGDFRDRPYKIKQAPMDNDD